MSFRVYFQEIIQRRYTIWAVWSLEWVVNSPFGVYSRPNSMDIHHFCRFGCIKCLQLISIYTICSFWEAFDPFTDKNGVNQEGHFQIIHPDHQMAIDSPDSPPWVAWHTFMLPDRSLKLIDKCRFAAMWAFQDFFFCILATTSMCVDTKVKDTILPMLTSRWRIQFLKSGCIIRIFMRSRSWIVKGRRTFTPANGFPPYCV